MERIKISNLTKILGLTAIGFGILGSTLCLAKNNDKVGALGCYGGSLLGTLAVGLAENYQNRRQNYAGGNQ